jgi:hypothetical protein
VFLYLLLVCNDAGIDLLQAAENKLAKNALKYPVDESYGSAEKYNRLKQRGRERGPAGT